MEEVKTVKEVQTIITDYIKEEDKLMALKSYYVFFNDLYGSRRIPLIGKEIDYSMNPTKFVDKLDGNLKEAINAVKQANNNPMIKVINLVDKNGRTIAIARFRITQHYYYNEGDKFEPYVPILGTYSIHLGEIVFLNIPPVLVSECYEVMIKAFEEYAINHDITNLSIETFKEESILKDMALNLGYSYDEKNRSEDRSYGTIVLDKELNLEKGEDFGRNRTRK